MGISIRVGARQQLQQTVQLTTVLHQAIQIAVQSHLFGLRTQLVGDLRGEQYRPKAVCPKCSYALIAQQIIQGFRRDPTDFTTKCPRCNKRFEATLVTSSGISTMEIPFYCPSQVLAMLPGTQEMSPAKMSKANPAVYRSAIVHHGTLRRAFAKIGIDYGFEEIPTWKDKVGPYLGMLPDGTIAACVGVSAGTIARLRRNREIPPFRKEDIEVELGEFAGDTEAEIEHLVED